MNNFEQKKKEESFGVEDSMKEKTLIREKIILLTGQKRFSIIDQNPNYCNIIRLQVF